MTCYNTKIPKSVDPITAHPKAIAEADFILENKKTAILTPILEAIYRLQ